MSSVIIDIDTLNSATEAIDIIRVYRLLAERGATFINFCPDVSYDDNYELRISLLETFSEEVFPAHMSYQVNEECFPYKAHFTDVMDYFDPDEVGVMGLFFNESYLHDFYKMCKEKNINIVKTNLSHYVDRVNHAIPDNGGDSMSYMEFFIPLDAIIEDTKSPLVLFYSDPSIINYDALESMFHTFDYCKRVVDGEIELKEVI